MPYEFNPIKAAINDMSETFFQARKRQAGHGRRHNGG